MGDLFGLLSGLGWAPVGNHMESQEQNRGVGEATRGVLDLRVLEAAGRLRETDMLIRTGPAY